MSGNRLIQLKKEVLNRIVITSTTYWDDGKCELESTEAHAIVRKICAVRQTKRKKKPFVVHVKFPACDQFEESICKITLDHVMKMIQPAQTENTEIRTSSESKKVAVSDASENVTEADASEICIKADADKNVSRSPIENASKMGRTPYETPLVHQESSSSSDDNPIAMLANRRRSGKTKKNQKYMQVVTVKMLRPQIIILYFMTI